MRIAINKIMYLSLNISLFLFLAGTVHAQSTQYTPIVGIPGLQTTSGRTVPEYINALYVMIIAIGALIGVLKIAFAGVKYSMSDVITDKASAKKDITGVLLGLAILLIPFIVLNTIYPGLTNLDVLRLSSKVNLGVTPSNTQTTSPLQQKTEPCTYDTNCTTSVGAGEFECVPTVFDDRNCRARCAQKKGTFSDRDGKSSICTYSDEASPRFTTPTTLDGTPVESPSSNAAQLDSP